MRQSAVECLGLATLAGALSLLFATWATSMAMTLVAAIEPVDFALELNARVLAVATCCALVAVVHLQLAPVARRGKKNSKTLDVVLKGLQCTVVTARLE